MKEIWGDHYRWQVIGRATSSPGFGCWKCSLALDEASFRGTRLGRLELLGSLIMTMRLPFGSFNHKGTLLSNLMSEQLGFGLPTIIDSVVVTYLGHSMGHDSSLSET